MSYDLSFEIFNADSYNNNILFLGRPEPNRS